jgi:hypothetical protein
MRDYFNNVMEAHDTNSSSNQTQDNDHNMVNKRADIAILGESRMQLIDVTFTAMNI